MESGQHLVHDVHWIRDARSRANVPSVGRLFWREEARNQVGYVCLIYMCMHIF